MKNAHNSKNVDIATNKAVKNAGNVENIENNLPHWRTCQKMVNPSNVGKM